MKDTNRLEETKRVQHEMDQCWAKYEVIRLSKEEKLHEQYEKAFAEYEAAKHLNEKIMREQEKKAIAEYMSGAYDTEIGDGNNTFFSDAQKALVRERRRATRKSKKDVKKNAKIALKNMRKRESSDNLSHRDNHHPKSKVAKATHLQQKARKLRIR